MNPSPCTLLDPTSELYPSVLFIHTLEEGVLFLVGMEV